MSVAFKQYKLYFKILVIGAVLLIIGLTLFKNRDNVATVWFFRSYEDVNVLKLMLLTAVGAVAGAWVLLVAGRLWLEYRSLAKKRRQEDKGAPHTDGKKHKAVVAPLGGESSNDHSGASK